MTKKTEGSKGVAFGKITKTPKQKAKAPKPKDKVTKPKGVNSRAGSAAFGAKAKVEASKPKDMASGKGTESTATIRKTFPEAAEALIEQENASKPDGVAKAEIKPLKALDERRIT